MDESVPGAEPLPAAGEQRRDPQPAPRKKRARVIAPPRHLQARVQLTGSYTPVPHTSSVDESSANSRPASSIAQAASPAKTTRDPLAGLRAKDDDPRLWGDAPEDLAEAMKREKPPHWG